MPPFVNLNTHINTHITFCASGDNQAKSAVVGPIQLASFVSSNTPHVNNLEITDEHGWTALVSEAGELITQRSVVQIHPPQPSLSTTCGAAERSKSDPPTYLFDAFPGLALQRPNHELTISRSSGKRPRAHNGKRQDSSFARQVCRAPRASL